MKSRFNFSNSKGYSLLLVRMIVAWRLTAGTWPFVLHKEPISDVQQFFIKINVPAPLISAYVSVYAQFFCGMLFIIGLWMRPAALIMIINFLIAILIAHLHNKIESSFPAWALLGFSILFVNYGAGNLSFDKLRNKG